MRSRVFRPMLGWLRKARETACTLTRADASGIQSVDLTPLIRRRYDYRLKFELGGAGTGLAAVRIGHDLQHSQRVLPVLAQGENTIRCSVGAPEGTITLEGSTDPRDAGRQLVFTGFHPTSAGLAKNKLLLAGRAGEITFPVETPGELTRLRLGTCYRARDVRDGWDVQVSSDDGATFRTIDRLTGPAVTAGTYRVVTDLPAGTRRALVRYVGTQHNTTMISNFRISADYREPHGGFRPVRVVYQWEEDGVAKQDVRVVTRPTESYTITCAGRPVMNSIQLELAE